MDHEFDLYDEQFTTEEVASVTGLTPGQLKGMIDRKQVTIRTHNPGTGRRRMFCASDIVKLAAAKAVGALGFPLKFTPLLADQIESRAYEIIFFNKNRMSSDPLYFVCFPVGDGDDWAYVSRHEEAEIQGDHVPAAVIAIDADRIIHETLAKLIAIAADAPMPEFPVLSTKRLGKDRSKFEKDEQGREVLLGLTWEETDALLAYRQDFSRHKSGDHPFNRAEMLGLEDKHRLARHDRLRKRGSA